jgi:hypothetical protein
MHGLEFKLLSLFQFFVIAEGGLGGWLNHLQGYEGGLAHDHLGKLFLIYTYYKE